MPRANAVITLDELRWRREELLRIAAAYGARNVRVFGSVARGVADTTSDVDVLVDFSAGVGGLDYFGRIEDLRRALSAALVCEVDIVDSAALGRAHERIRREAVPL